MRIAHPQARVLKRPPRHVGNPQGSAPLQARHPCAVGHRMPLVQLRVRVDDLLVPQQPVAEVVDYGGDGEDAPQTLIKSRLTHNSVLLTEPQPRLRPWSRSGSLHEADGTLLAAYAPPPQRVKRPPQ